MTGAVMIVSFAVHSIRPAHDRRRVSLGPEEPDQGGCDFNRPLVRDIVAAPCDRSAGHMRGELLEHRHHLRTESLVPAQAKHGDFERLLGVVEEREARSEKARVRRVPCSREPRVA